MKKKQRRRRPASVPGGRAARVTRDAPRPARAKGEGSAVVASKGSSARAKAKGGMAAAVAPRPRWEGRNRALLIGLFAFAATAFVAAITVGVMVDLKEHGRTRLEALIGVSPSHASTQP